MRIVIGEEVIRRFCDLPRSADEQDIRAATQKILQDDGYEFDGTVITIQQPRAA